jgi:hypothetical protein
VHSFAFDICQDSSIVPTVEIGGASILSLLIADPGYGQNDLRQDLWRAGHAHAGVWLVLSLVALRYVDEASLSEGMRWVVRLAFPAAAILMPLAFFLSVLSLGQPSPTRLSTWLSWPGWCWLWDC